MKTLVEITNAHILKGTRKSCRDCPVALALVDLCDEDIKITIIERIIKFESITDKEFYHAVKKPDALIKFIRYYDDGFDPLPISFELDIPEWALV